MTLVHRTQTVLRADPRRVLARFFVPGHELVLNQESRASNVLDRFLALSEDDASAALAQVHQRYAGRHRDLDEVLHASYAQIAHRLPPGSDLGTTHRALLGAFFSHEYAVAGAALLNPSVVAHPDQTGLGPGQCRFVMSVREIGEGHISSIGFRTGVFGPDEQLHIDEPDRQLDAGTVIATAQQRELLRAKLEEEGANAESLGFLISRLPARFDANDLSAAVELLIEQRETRRDSARVAELARAVASSSYELVHQRDVPLSARVLWPRSPLECRGMEDARFVRFVDDDGTVDYRATYTAFDGQRVCPQLIMTKDFVRFQISLLAGPAARNKGLALFPRRVGGRQLALSRWDRESTTLATSDDGAWWADAAMVHRPVRAWELTTTGNCGSPLETEAGWLVLTHGVGPMREYAIGALLLDLEDPRRVIGDLHEPLIAADTDEREGYVPNVVYSCGALIHGQRILLPYGAADSSIRFAVIDLADLLARLLDGPS